MSLYLSPFYQKLANKCAETVPMMPIITEKAVEDDIVSQSDVSSLANYGSSAVTVDVNPARQDISVSSSDHINVASVICSGNRKVYLFGKDQLKNIQLQGGGQEKVVAKAAFYKGRHFLSSVLSIVATTYIILALFLYNLGPTAEVPFNLTYVSRAEWNATEPSGSIEKLELKSLKVVVAHTGDDSCETLGECSAIMRRIQKSHMQNWKIRYDISYNFAIGGDARVYKARGWRKEGAHTPQHNKRSIGVAFIGNYNSPKKPTSSQMKAFDLLIIDGIKSGFLDENYKLFGQRQLGIRVSPGDELYAIIRRKDHWTDEIMYVD